MQSLPGQRAVGTRTSWVWVVLVLATSENFLLATEMYSKRSGYVTELLQILPRVTEVSGSVPSTARKCWMFSV